jgi:4-coumarate--CoA ligase
MLFKSSSAALPQLLDDLTVPQFIFDFQHESRPVRSEGIAWLVEDETGRKISGDEVRRFIEFKA